MKLRLPLKLLSALLSFYAISGFHVFAATLQAQWPEVRVAERMVTDGFPEKATVWVVNLDCWGDGYTAEVAARAEPARKAATLKPHWRS